MQVPDWYEGNVSRETSEKLGAFADLLRKWTVKINLISKATQDDIDTRHIWDSAQIYEQGAGRWLDVGSGGGLPGVVVAILAQGDGSDWRVTMVESDQRKVAFLRTCARELDVPCTIVASRIEDQEAQRADVVSARALASLDRLLDLSVGHLGQGGRCVFMKGATWKDEMEEAQRTWRFSCEVAQSKTNPQAAILTVKDIQRV